MQVHAFRLERHHLLRRATGKDLLKVAGVIAGLHAQLMSAAEMQVGVRVECRATDGRDALWTDRTMVKTWLMRGTLHLIPAADLPLYTAAMSTRWIRTRNSWLKFAGLSEPELMKFIDVIGEALDGTPRTREELIATAGGGRSDRVQTPQVRVGRHAQAGRAERAAVLRAEPRPERDIRPPKRVVGSLAQGRSRRGARRDRSALPARLRPGHQERFRALVGQWPGVGAAAWAGLAGELAPVSVEGQLADLLPTDLEAAASQPATSTIQLLPSFDPYLMGYASRAHLVEAVHAPKVSRTAGWISVVVLVDGRVAGTWSHVAAKQTLNVTVEPFRRLAP